MALTERVIRDAQAGPKTVIVWDAQVKGFGVRVTPAGAKSYILNYHLGGRRYRRATLARCSEMGLKAARERAGRELAAIRAGETDPLERRREAREAPTVADGIELFFREYLPGRIERGRMAERTAADYRQQCNRYILPAIGKRRVADVTRHDIERMLKPLKPVQRNRVAALTSRLFNLFETWEWRPQRSNPVRGIERAREEPRDRVLSPSELAALASALGKEEERSPPPPWAPSGLRP